MKNRQNWYNVFILLFYDKKMRKKFIIFDFDWTLVDSNTKDFFEGVIPMIKRLSKEYKLLISSQADDDFLKETLKNAQVYDNFEIVFGWSVREKGEKHIEVFDMVLDDQNFTNRTVYVWDSELDREIAKESWISFVKVWKEWQDYYEIDKVTEIENYLEKVR